MKRKYLTVITALILSSLIGEGAKASETGAEFRHAGRCGYSFRNRY